MSLNKVMLVGRTTKDLKKLITPSGHPVVHFSLAVDRNYTNKEGNRETDFIPVVAWNRLAEILEQYAVKGTLVAVVGRLQTRRYTDGSGKNVRILEVVAEEISLLARPRNTRQEEPAPELEAAEEKAEPAEETNFVDEDFEEITIEDLENLFTV
ncbi:single-strand DNA-binding protein [Caldanaerobacter subterraneus subsp. tengcongensis MB4]|uniref:Single-stranded DNA-binding protein n=1 Tax=Caldanaerobacter subterraneus subsp. tengcongensis (strain DSM 15242 / JCM 11007 / NBRC 100824 / MB4) TaxID=273068 RepID=Q8R8F1_CALS4|nr:single-stranded DNA-binding protein [Caldanaerobacter subterraneus]AAM25227.1 Single-stranded DNA-binding protein [Caldanaerobacter subterraneus subsp. tengcongensis MB4]MCS3915176.1 single-strand DNA-binding protein [Caldanaerobacter subterraneus subsp. tengcongensis MB4]